MGSGYKRIILTILSITYLLLAAANRSQAAQGKPEKSTVRIGTAFISERPFAVCDTLFPAKSLDAPLWSK